MSASDPKAGSTRRAFLGGTGLAVSGAILAKLTAARAVFAEALAETRPGLPGADAYGLADGVTYLNHASVGTMPRLVRDALQRYLDVCETNPWLHIWNGRACPVRSDRLSRA